MSVLGQAVSERYEEVDKELASSICPHLSNSTGSSGSSPLPPTPLTPVMQQAAAHTGAHERESLIASRLVHRAGATATSPPGSPPPQPNHQHQLQPQPIQHHLLQPMPHPATPGLLYQGGAALDSGLLTQTPPPRHYPPPAQHPPPRHQPPLHQQGRQDNMLEVDRLLEQPAVQKRTLRRLDQMANNQEQQAADIAGIKSSTAGIQSTLGRIEHFMTGGGTSGMQAGRNGHRPAGGAGASASSLSPQVGDSLIPHHGSYTRPRAFTALHPPSYLKTSIPALWRRLITPPAPWKGLVQNSVQLSMKTQRNVRR